MPLILKSEPSSGFRLVYYLITGLSRHPIKIPTRTEAINNYKKAIQKIQHVPIDSWRVDIEQAIQQTGATHPHWTLIARRYKDGKLIEF